MPNRQLTQQELETLADPAFRPLADWLRQRQVRVDDVQSAVDQCLEQARQSSANT
jgi:hypothetical protein